MWLHLAILVVISIGFTPTIVVDGWGASDSILTALSLNGRRHRWFRSDMEILEMKLTILYLSKLSHPD
jgi:hypothetical protein